jgi:hypothetical protein
MLQPVLILIEEAFITWGLQLLINPQPQQLLATSFPADLQQNSTAVAGSRVGVISAAYSLDGNAAYLNFKTWKMADLANRCQLYRPGEI